MQKILVIEDEEPQLKLLLDILQGAGFKAVGTKDGIEAREVYRREQGDFDLVLSDMALPRLGGWTVYLMLKEINPNLKMILTSGYLDAKVKEDLVRGGVKDFIPKPYMAETIVASVKHALSGP